MKVLVHYPFTAEQIEGLCAVAPGAEVVHAATEAEAIQHAADAEVLLGLFPPPVFAASRQLRWIQSHSAGMDSFLYPAVIESDAVVTNMAGLYASQGAEHAWGMLLALARGFPHYIRAQQQREWRGTRVVELRGGTLGIIGMGGFGQHMVARAAGYEMTIIALDAVRTDPPPGVSELRRPTPEALLDLMARSDAVMVACPKTPETLHMIGAAQLAAMKPTAFLVCVSRGGIIDENALAAALRSGQLAGAGLDVFEKEPLPSDSPLWDLEYVILTTHVAGSSQHRPGVVYDFFRENLRRYVAGEPLQNVIEKARGY